MVGNRVEKKIDGKIIYTRRLVKEHINEPYTQRVETINKKTIHHFIRPEWHREFRISHIASIKNSILQGTHFSEPITVNVLKSDYRVLNGNHRIEALKQILEVYPNFSMDIRITKYENLSLEKELEIYTIVNKVKPENILDKIKAHCQNSEFCQEANKNFPIRILFRNRSKKDINSLPITTITSPYILRNTKLFVGSGANLIEGINKLNDEDIDRIRKFFIFYKSVFGEIAKRNSYADGNIISVIGKIYYLNVGIELTEDQFRKQLENIKQRYTAQLIMSSGAGWERCKDLYSFLIDKLKVRKPLFNILTVKTTEE